MEELEQSFDRDLVPESWFRAYEAVKQGGAVDMKDTEEVAYRTNLSVGIINHIRRHYNKHKKVYG